MKEAYKNVTVKSKKSVKNKLFYLKQKLPLKFWNNKADISILWRIIRMGSSIRLLFHAASATMTYPALESFMDITVTFLWISIKVINLLKIGIWNLIFL